MTYTTRKYLILRRCLIIFILVCSFNLIITHLFRKYNSNTNITSDHFEQISEAVELEKNSNMTSIVDRMQSRKSHFKEKCSLLGLDQQREDRLHRPNAWEYLISDKHHLIWCNVFKAASTSWMYNFNLLAGYSPEFLRKTSLIPMNLARQKYGRPTISALTAAFNTSVSFIIARHPLERILSAYREKLEGLPFNYLRKLGAEIASRYKILHEPPKNTKGPTFPQFIEYLLDAFRSKIILDIHWSPITEFCTPCLFDFTVIAHTETLEEDQMYLIKLAHLEDILHPEWKNANKDSTSKQDIIGKYYSQLTKSTIWQLYSFYRYDFEVFNYTLVGYLEHGIDEKFEFNTSPLSQPTNC